MTMVVVILKKSIKYVNFGSLAQFKLQTYCKLFTNSIQEKLSTNSGTSEFI